MAREIQGQFTCAAGDSWDWLALIFFHNEKYGVDLISANPEYSGLNVFKGGEVILIPKIDEAEEAAGNDEEVLANTAAPWK